MTLALPAPLAQRLELLTLPTPFIARRVYAALLDGSFVPMDDKALGQANARGDLVMMVLHFSMRTRELDDPYVHNVLTVANDAFRSLHAPCFRSSSVMRRLATSILEARAETKASAAQRNAARCSPT